MSAFRFPRIRALLCLALLLASTALLAGVRKVDPGESIELEPDEGLLVIGVDTPIDLKYLRVKRNGAWFDAGSLRSMKAGLTSQLYVVPEGKYRWDEVSVGYFRFVMGDDEEYAFDVKPGVINYPGHLVFRPRGDFHALLHVTNRGLLSLDWLQQQHPTLIAEHELAYAGHYPDPFPAAYRAARTGASKPEDVTRDPPAAGKLPISIADLWRDSRIADIDLNAAGDLLALVINERVGEQLTSSVQMVDLIGLTSQHVLSAPEPIRRIDWSGDRALVVSVDATARQDAVFVLRASEARPSASRRYERLNVPRLGLLVDALPEDPDHILFSTTDSRNDRRVHRLDIRTQKGLDDFRFQLKSAIDGGIDNDLAWFADGRGRLRAALAIEDDAVVLMHGQDGAFRKVLDADAIDGFTPMALSADGDMLYGWTDKDRAQRDLVEFDPAKGSIGKTLFSRAGHDVQGVLFDSRRNLIGASYFEGGQVVSHYFDEDDTRHYLSLRQAFPDKSIAVLDRDADAKNFVLLVGGSDEPGSIYHYDAVAKRASLIEQTRPWLSGKRLGRARIVKAKSKDGFAIEAYLTLPPGEPSAKLPLVVFPHGGPIGIRDSRYFDPEVQFLVSLGYAVLQVNFRGSEGFGTAFREAGRRSYGTLIEDDIDVALSAALAEYPLDPDRMCVIGASYGGYSALVSAIRWPERFRCVVSMSGISDQLLFFTASDSGRSAEGRKALEQAIGDPRRDLDAMRRNSPLYRIDALDAPVMLVHGTEDLRVDQEHSRRLVRMLNLAGRPPTAIVLEGEGHGIEDKKNMKRVWEGVAGFLRAHLGTRHP